MISILYIFYKNINFYDCNSLSRNLEEIGDSLLQSDLIFENYYNIASQDD